MLKYPTMIALLYFLTFTSASTASAEDSASRPFDLAVDFIENNMIGKTLETKVVTKINKGNIETEFYRRVMYTNLLKNGDSASFDAVILVRQSLWDLNEKGERINDKPRIENRTIVSRYGLHALKSTDDVIGNCVPLLNSAISSIGQGGPIQLKMENNTLKMVSLTSLYFDGFGKQGSWVPMASRVTTTFSSIDGKLSATTIEEGFDVDPDTLERKPNGHHVTLHSKEIPGLF